jgi:hypothetical protein
MKKDVECWCLCISAYGAVTKSYSIITLLYSRIIVPYVRSFLGPLAAHFPLVASLFLAHPSVMPPFGAVSYQ